MGKWDDLEIDFVAMDEKEQTYYQVATTVRDEACFSTVHYGNVAEAIWSG